jgi:NADPH:quinone reductase-like Zn-dependent oxidoreductase
LNAGKADRLAANDLNPENGAFARFIAVKGDLQLHIPEGVSFEAACTVGVGIGTLGFGLYNVLGLPLPETIKDVEPKSILIYGGSTATGTLAIQFARL